MTTGADADLDDVGLRYANGTRALDRRLPRAARRRVRQRRRAVRVRQEHAAPAGRRPARADRRARCGATAERVGFVFQDPTLLPWRSVRRNVELVGELSGLSRAERIGRADGGTATGRARRRRRPATGHAVRRHADAGLAGPGPERPARTLYLFDEPFGAVDEITRGRPGRASCRTCSSRTGSRRCSSPTRSPRRSTCPAGCW